MRLQGNDCTSTAMDRVQSSPVQKRLAVSLAITLDKIRDTSGWDIVDDVIKIYNREAFCTAVFKRVMKCIHEYEVITE